MYIPAVVEVASVFGLVRLDAADVVRRTLHQRLDQLVRLRLHSQQHQTKQLCCVEPPLAALGMTLPAFAAERRLQQHGARRCR